MVLYPSCICQWIVFSEEAAMDDSALSVHIQRQLDALDAKTAFFAKHLASAKTIAIRADDPLNTLSVIKLAIMVLAYRDAEQGTQNQPHLKAASRTPTPSSLPRSGQQATRP